MKVGLLGGSFNPPHMGHLFIAAQVREILELDEVWLLPCFRLQPGFEKEFAAVEHRLAMTKFLESDGIRVSDFEIIRNQGSLTIDTLEMLSQERPQDTFYWITGSDQLKSFQKYDRWQDIIGQHNLVVFPREYILPQLDEKVKSAFAFKEIPDTVTILDSPDLILSNISSTKIRERVRVGRSIRYFVPKEVEQYILENSLYNK